MSEMEIIYPEGLETTEEEREFDSFLLNYITELAVKNRSPKVRIVPEELMKAWEERSVIKH